MSVRNTDFGKGEKWVDVAEFDCQCEVYIFIRQVSKEDGLPCTLVPWWLDGRKMEYTERGPKPIIGLQYDEGLALFICRYLT